MEQIYVVETKSTHYVLGVDSNNNLRHIYWGEKQDGKNYCIPKIKGQSHINPEFDVIEQEYTPYGGTMYHNPAFKCEYFDKCRDSVFKVANATQTDGKLTVKLKDNEYKIVLILTYLYDTTCDIITRYVEVINNSTNDLKLEKIMSAELNLPGNDVYDVTNTNGSWFDEFKTETTTLKCGQLTFESKKGTAGHTNSPFVILSQNAEEDSGRVYFAALGYSGNFKVEIQRDFLGKTRAILGISDFDFSYTLKPGETFKTPKVYIGFANGFATMSNQMNTFVVNNILPKSFSNKPLPVLYNSWEAVNFNVNFKNQLKLAKIASEIGCELFVIDDGWFSSRNDSTSGLGDWFVNQKKFPNGLKEIVDEVNSLGMEFGLWIEPEMVQVNSELYKAHPEWIYHFKTRKNNELRNQLVLNMTIPEVQEHVFNCLDNLLKENNIRYLKWDMNRPFSETGAENLENQQELWYRHTMAVYEITDKLKKKYPHLMLEACCSGGGRTELGSIEHFDWVWPSDNTDPVDRLKIQYGYSLLYPIKCMRTWVTDMNLSNRSISLDYRFNVSMQGSLSIGANLSNYTKDELEKCKKYISFYKQIRETIQFGDFYRLRTNKNSNYFATQYVSKDKLQSIVFICSLDNLSSKNKHDLLKLKGLDENTIYQFSDGKNKVKKSGISFMNEGKKIFFEEPLESKIWILEKA